MKSFLRYLNIYIRNQDNSNSQGSNFNSKHSKTPLTQTEGKPYVTVTKKVANFFPAKLF